ncbi:uncharacterized protein LOC134209841 [Armigeres subalbatus]|uniref:uncharacterized protein LOC134209841 n=1 Tax=Armigeres subalbatus TaxID=124917 RepID=UPI002ED69D29
MDSTVGDYMKCRKSNKICDMVQCDTCQSWAHFSCVGVTAAIKDSDWSCDKCSDELQVPKLTKRSSSKKGSSKSKSERGSIQPSIPEGTAGLNEELRKLEAEQRAMEKALEEEMIIREKRLDMERVLQEKRCRKEKEFHEKQMQQDRDLKERQLREEREMLERQLKEEARFASERKKLHEHFQDTKKAISKSISEETEGAIGGEKLKNDNELSFDKNVQFWLKQRNQGRNGVKSKLSCSIADSEDYGEIEEDDAPEEKARQAVSKNLPVFKGEAEKWPMFISCFEYTTKACGFSNLDNLKRLQDCLQGDALEAVRSRLVLPESVPDVINDLRRIFGRPEKLLKTLLTKVRNAQAPRADRLETFMQFGITVKQLCDHLEAAKLADHLNNPMLVQELVEKLPSNYKMDWVRFKRSRIGSPLRIFTDFMNDIVADASEVSEFSTLFLSDTREASHFPPPSKETKPCLVCRRSDHKLRFCDDFKRFSFANRLKVVEQHKLCALCLNNHGKSRCTFRIRCNINGCQGGHHPLLHHAEGSVQLMDIACNAHGALNRGVIFWMVPVTLYFGDHALDILAFLDEGSSSTLVEDAVARELDARGLAEPLVVTWTGNVKRFETTSKRVNLMISARESDEKLPLKDVRTVAELKLPKQTSYEIEEPRIILGLDNLNVFAPLESRVGSPGEPIGVKSKLGWTVYGPQPSGTVVSEVRVILHSLEPMTNQELHDAMRSQFLLDDPSVASVAESNEDARARNIMQTTTMRVGDRYENGLLWRRDEQRFPDSYPMAISRLKALERKLERDPELGSKVHQLIAEYLIKGYAHKATVDELADMAKGNVWYIPLNVVINPQKLAKIRLVWDTRAPVNGISLNSELLTGPDQLVPLQTVISKFRERRVAFGGDIQEIYHQFRIRRAGRKFQSFLFRRDPGSSPETYVMDVGTFGAKCSPCSAQFIKNLNAAQFEQQFPEASAAIINKHYVDDYYDSVDTVDEAIKIATDVKLIHSRRGFHIRNWVSNTPNFLEAMGEQPITSTVRFHQDKETLTERVLGIVWNPVDDVLSFSTATRPEYHLMLHGDSVPSKRIVLSSVMSMFDPLGLLSPFTVYGRILIQDLWRTGCSWDEPIDGQSFEKWTRWTKALPSIEAIRIPRSYFGQASSADIQDLQLHIITDASKGAYGCSAYFRAVVNGRIQCVLVSSRVKVAPLKPMSVPWLELQAAVLGARLAVAVRSNHTFNIAQQVFWTDSTTVLSWITSDVRRYKEFVGLRIGEMLTLSKLCEWRWVPTRLNVADQLTKWTRDPNLNSDSEWFIGPKFLYREEEDWPKQKRYESTQEEAKVHLLAHDIQLLAPIIDVHRFSKWTVLVRTMATVFRFVSNCRRKINGLSIEVLKATDRQAKTIKKNYSIEQYPLKQLEYEKAERILIKVAQAESFGNEVKVLMRNANVSVADRQQIEKSSFLYKLTPLIDGDGILRMESRVERAEFLSFNPAVFWTKTRRPPFRVPKKAVVYRPRPIPASYPPKANPSPYWQVESARLRPETTTDAQATLKDIGTPSLVAGVPGLAAIEEQEAGKEGKVWWNCGRK